MASEDTTVIGLTMAKINGLWHVDVRNTRASVKRANPQMITGAGARQALGEPVASGSFDEVIPRDKGFDWRSLKNFSIEIYDKETRSKVIFACEGCNWNGVDMQGNMDQATAGKAIAWNGNKPTVF